MGKIYTQLEDAFEDLLQTPLLYQDKQKHLMPLMKEGRNEKSMCFAIWKSREKILQFKGDSRFWGIIKNEIRKWSWTYSDPRWEDYNKRKDEEAKAKKYEMEVKAKPEKPKSQKSPKKKTKTQRKDDDYKALMEIRRQEKIQREDYVIYFIQAENGGPIKIGTTKDIAGRLKGLQTSTPYLLKVLTLIPGTQRREQAIHERLDKYRVRGEWFEDAPEVLELMKQWSEKYPHTPKATPT